MRLIRFVAAAFFLTQGNNAWASDWWFVNTAGGSPRAIEFFDRESLLPDQDGLTRGWSLTLYEQPDALGVAKTSSFYAYDCERRESALVSLVHYRRNGSVLRSLHWEDAELEFRPVVPDSIGSDSLAFACGRPSRAALQLTQTVGSQGGPMTPAEFAQTFFRNVRR